MVSNMNIYSEFTEETLGYVMEKVYKPKSGSLVKLYIPKIMQNIPKGKPEIKKSSVQYISGIVNDPACKPVISKLFYEQNFLTGIFEGNSNIESIAKTKKVKYSTLNIDKRYVAKLFNSTVITAPDVAVALKKSMDDGATEEKIVKQEVEAGKKVRVMFYNGKLNQIRINTDDNYTSDPNKDAKWDKNYKGKPGIYAKK